MNCRKDPKLSWRIAVKLDRKSDPGIYVTASSKTCVAENILLFCDGSRNDITALRLFMRRPRNDDGKLNWSQFDIDQDFLSIVARLVVSQHLSCLFYFFLPLEGSRPTPLNIIVLFPIDLISTFTGRLFLGLVCQWTSCLWPATSYLNAVFTNIKRQRDSHPCRDEFIKKHV